MHLLDVNDPVDWLMMFISSSWMNPPSQNLFFLLYFLSTWFALRAMAIWEQIYRSVLCYYYNASLLFVCVCVYVLSVCASLCVCVCIGKKRKKERMEESKEKNQRWYNTWYDVIRVCVCTIKRHTKESKRRGVANRKSTTAVWSSRGGDRDGREISHGEWSVSGCYRANLWWPLWYSDDCIKHKNTHTHKKKGGK